MRIAIVPVDAEPGSGPRGVFDIGGAAQGLAGAAVIQELSIPLRYSYFQVRDKLMLRHRFSNLIVTNQTFVRMYTKLPKGWREMEWR